MASKKGLITRIEQIDAVTVDPGGAQSVRDGGAGEPRIPGGIGMGKATISLSFQDGLRNEHSDILLSTDRAGWQNLLELVLSEACKAKSPSQEPQDA